MSDGKQGHIKVELNTVGAQRKLNLETQASSTISATQEESGVFRGFLISRNGKSSPVKLEKMTQTQAQALVATAASAKLAASSPVPALTGLESQFLSKMEMQAVSTGKKWRMMRSIDNHSVTWELREGGALFGNNHTLNANGSGTWSFNELGQVCVKWRDSSQDACQSSGRLVKLHDHARTATAAKAPPQSIFGPSTNSFSGL